MIRIKLKSSKRQSVVELHFLLLFYFIVFANIFKRSSSFYSCCRLKVTLREP